MIVSMYLLAIVVVLSLYYLYQRWTYKGPPHMTGVPIVGYLPFLRKEPYSAFRDIIEKRGPIFSLYMGSLYTVVLGSYDVVREAYIEKANVFSSRPSYFLLKVYENETAFVYLDGEDWKVTRNFSMNTLKSLGFGRNYTKNFVQADIHALVEKVRSHRGKPVNLEPILSRSINMLMLSLLTGRKYDCPDDTAWMDEVSTTADTLMKSYSYDLFGMFPWLRKIPFVNKLIVKKNIRILKKKLWKLLENEMASSKTSFSSSSSEPESFIQSWYQEQERRHRRGDPQRHLFSDFNLKNNLDILIQVSSDTTSTTLMWAFLYLILHPDIQAKVHREIEECIGHSREPCLEDNLGMHYTRAFLTEVNRAATIGPLGAFHSNKVKSTIRGYEIPENTVILTSFWSIHHDPKYFPEPFKFDPERFLDEEKKFKPREYMDPFGFGRRICPGKQVAELQLFLCLVSFLQVFELRSSPGSKPSDTEGVYDKTIYTPPWPFRDCFPRAKQINSVNL